MEMKSKILSVFLTFISLPLFCQEMSLPAKQQNLENLGKDGYSGMIQTYDSRYEGVKGSPYFTEEWSKGEVELENGSRYKKIELLYNVYTHELLGRNPGKRPVVIDEGMVRSFTFYKSNEMDSAKFIKAASLASALSGVDKHQYVQELYKGKCSLYAVNKKTLSKATFKGAYNTGKNYDEFSSLQADYFFVSQQGEVHPLKPKTQAVLKVLGEKKEILKTYINTQKLDPGQREDLIKLISYYDTQLTSP